MADCSRKVELQFDQPQADLDGSIDFSHCTSVNHAHTLDHSLPINGTDLVQPYR